MKILFTGASSFSGFWFCKQLAEAEHQVFATFTRSAIEDYPEAGFVRQRVRMLQEYVSPLWSLRAGSDAFIHLVETEPWDIICLHASYVKDHQSPDFPVDYAVEQNTYGMDRFIPLLKEKGVPVIWTGTYYEANEGKGSDPGVDISPYARSKRLSWERLYKLARKSGVPVGKFVMPNPFGPWEGKGLTSYLVKTWLSRDFVPCIKTPDYVRDNIPIDLMAKSYLHLIKEIAYRKSTLRYNPSMYIGSQRGFVEYFTAKMEQYFPCACQLEFARQAIFAEPMSRYNTDSAQGRHIDWDESMFWTNLIEWYLNHLR